MKKLFQISAMLLLLSCTQEEVSKNTNPVARTHYDCYLSEFTASNNETIKYVMEDGKLVKMGYGDFLYNPGYTYDEEGKIIKQSGNGLVINYYYNDKDQFIKSETLHNDTLVSTSGYTYDNIGYPKTYYSIHNLNGPIQSYIEEEFEYMDGNPIKTTSYLYTSEDRNKRLIDIVTFKYDDKINPINTLHFSYGYAMKNNPVKVLYTQQPGNDTYTEYQYNEKGYPISYKHTLPNHPDKPIITGEYKYVCEN